MSVQTLQVGADRSAIVERVRAPLFPPRASPEADGIFISSAGSPAVDIIEGLEGEGGLPVVTSDQALL